MAFFAWCLTPVIDLGWCFLLGVWYRSELVKMLIDFEWCLTPICELFVKK